MGWPQSKLNVAVKHASRNNWCAWINRPHRVDLSEWFKKKKKRVVNFVNFVNFVEDGMESSWVQKYYFWGSVDRSRIISNGVISSNWRNLLFESIVGRIIWIRFREGCLVEVVSDRWFDAWDEIVKFGRRRDSSFWWMAKRNAWLNVGFVLIVAKDWPNFLVKLLRFLK